MMKKTKIIATLGSFGIIALSAFLLAADHVDAPDVVGTSTDIADLYAFEGSNPDNTVFIATVQGVLEPGTITGNAVFDEDVLIEFNIDNTGDFVEDLVIQVIKRNDDMYFFGPAQVGSSETGLSSSIYTSSLQNSVEISDVDEQIVSTNDGMSFFAGPRRDAFFFDFNRFNSVVSGSVAPEGFLSPATASDFFEQLNTLAIVVEVPNSMLGDAPAHVGGAVGIDGLPPAYNVWVSAKRKQ